MRCIAIALGLTLVFPATRALAAGAPPYRGERVQVTAARPGTMGARSLEVLRGAWLGARESSLVLVNEAGPETLVVPLTRVTRLQVSRVGEGHAAEGAVLGGMAGVLLGAALGASAYESEKGIRIGSSGQWSFAWAVGFGAIGVLTGALTGNAIRNMEWEEVPLERLEARLSLDGNEPGARLGVRVRF